MVRSGPLVLAMFLLGRNQGWNRERTNAIMGGLMWLCMILALIPLIALALVQANQNFPFGGASILILVGVGLETVKQIDSKVQQHHYEGFLR